MTGLRGEIKDANSGAGFLVTANNCVYEAPWYSVVMCTYCVTATNCNRIPGYRTSASERGEGEGMGGG